MSTPAFRPPGPHVRRIAQTGGPWIVRVFFSAFIRVRCWHTAEFPRSGGVLLAGNHISHFDPPIISTWCRRRVDWMAMEELFRNPIAGRLLAGLGAFPVDRRGTDRRAIRIALRRLAEGNVVGIFPEGGIRAGVGSILEGAPLRPGVSALSVISQKPVVPVVIVGSDRLYRPSKWIPFPRTPVWIVFGKALSPGPAAGREASRTELDARLSTAFQKLKTTAVEHFQLTSDDLPTTPQARKGDDPRA